MTYDEVLERARGNMGPHCKACPSAMAPAVKIPFPAPAPKDWGPYFPAIMQHGRRLP